MSTRGRRSRVYVRRRAAALGGLAVLAAAIAVIVGSFGTDTRGAKVVRFTINSALVHRALPVVAVTGPGSNGQRPLLVFLHGKGEDQNSNVNAALFAALARLGAGAPAVVFPYGGDDSYWHDRAGAAWGAYVMREVIPQALRRLHADPTRVAIGGISMGGFGALNLARLHPGAFCAAGGHSPALWLSGADSAAGAFDDAQDFARNDVLNAAQTPNPYPATKVWIDTGTQDPFRATATTLAQTLRAHGHAVAFHIWPGGHDQTYWQAHSADYLAFYADALQGCHHAHARPIAL